jgi:methionyl-tRNA formyltransferase
VEITVLSDEGSWKNKAILAMAEKLRQRGHQVSCLHDAEAVRSGDILFILGFFKIVPGEVLKRNKTNVVVHESDLPKGRGWSPVTWLILEGAKEIPLTLFKAVEKVDAGAVYLRAKVKLKGDELLPEVRMVVAAAIMRLCEQFAARYPQILKQGTAQRGKPTYYPKRKPEDSRLNPNKSVAKQFDLLRTVDNESYPAFFTHRGATYVLKIEKKKS